MDKVYFEYKKQKISKEEDQKESNMCVVYGCPRIGTITQDGRRNCRYHWNRHGDILARVTQALKMHEYLFNWNELLSNSNEVDYFLKDIHKKAPHNLMPEQKETWKEYKTRIQNEVNKHLLINNHKGI